MAQEVATAFDHTPTTHEALVGARFNGPPKSGNGGYAVGLLAKHFSGAVEVTLKRPIPLEQSLQVVTDGASGAMFHDGTEIASARATELDLEIPTAITFQEAAAARAEFAGYQAHPFPDCFVCGTHRHCGDGMCLFTGKLDERTVASSWVPNEEFADADGHVSAEFLGAALDCPGAWALIGQYDITGPVVLGRMVYESFRPVHAGGRYSVLGWTLGKDGRKSFCGTAVFDADGVLCAAAKATWIELK
ncbi:MAG: hotdog fold domain-containing protein [Myxococcota bacterium]